MEVALDDLEEQLPESNKTTTSKKKRNRGFPDALPRKRIELTLTEGEKAGANSTFFSKVKEELSSNACRHSWRLATR